MAGLCTSEVELSGSADIGIVSHESSYNVILVTPVYALEQ
jgi:hypothetical protein